MNRCDGNVQRYSAEAEGANSPAGGRALILPAPVGTVQCLQGVAEFTAAGRDQLLRTGQLVYLGEGTPHSLKGIEDASVLVTIVAGAQKNPASA